MDRGTANQIPEAIFVVMTDLRLHFCFIRIYCTARTGQLFHTDCIAEIAHVNRFFHLLVFREPQ